MTEPALQPTVRLRSWQPGPALRLLLTAVLLGLSMIISTPSQASAHAVLVDSSPRDGTRLDHLPGQVELHFDEPVRVVPDASQVINSAGDRVDAGRTRATDAGRTVIIGLSELGDRPDSYLVSWRVTSADGHPVDGSLQFGVRQPASMAGSAIGGQDAQDRYRTMLATAGSALGYAGLVAAVGCLAAALVVWPATRRSARMAPVIIAGTVTIGTGGTIELIADGAAITGLASGVGDGLGEVIRTPAGQLLLARMFLAIVLLPLSLSLLSDSGHRRTAIWGAVATGLLITTAADGHALGGSQRAITILATTGHLAGMCCWLGGLAVLIMVVVPRMQAVPPALGRAVTGWSRFAFGCVAVLIISGELLAWRQVQPVEALWQTRYGVILVIKLALVALAVVLGRSISWLLRRGRSRRWVKSLLGVEVATSAMIIVVASLLSATPPATDTYGPPASATAEFDQGRLLVDVASTRRGPQQITVQPQSRSGGPVELQELTGQLSSTAAGVSALDVQFSRSGDVWHSTDATAPLPGPWTLQLTARPASGPSYVTSIDYRVW